MAGVFKSLDQSDIRIVPFRAHKQWANDLNYSLSPAPSDSVASGFNLKYVHTNFSESVNNGNNYYYYMGNNGELYVVDGRDNYAIVNQTTNTPTLLQDFLSSAGEDQNRIMYFNQNTTTVCAHASDLSNLDVDTFSIPDNGPRQLSWLPGANMVLISGENLGPDYGLISVDWDNGSNTFTAYNYFNTEPDADYLGTTFGTDEGVGDIRFFGAFTSGSEYTVYFEYKKSDGGRLDISNSSSLVYPPDAVKDFVSNGNLKPSAFVTFKGGVGLWMVYSETMNVQQYDLDVVRLLQDKDLYRNGTYNTARTFAVLRDGIILCDLYANSTGFGWTDTIDTRRLIGSGQIIAATINKNVDLLDSAQPLTITVYGVTNPTPKAPIVVYSINLETQEISEPTHFGCHNTEGPSPFLGDDGNVSINFVGDNSINKVVGFMYQSDNIDITTGGIYSQIYTFNI